MRDVQPEAENEADGSARRSPDPCQGNASKIESKGLNGWVEKKTGGKADGQIPRQ